MRKIVLMALFGATLTMALPVIEPTQVKAEQYENTMKTLYKNVTAKDAENLRLCKIFAEKGKEYKALNRSDKYYDATVKNCERRVRLYCGSLMAATEFENQK